jgi:choline dehydrogenase
MTEWDYIVVGAGSAGSVLAARLSESGRHRVLLLEAGPGDRRLWVRIPLGYAKSFMDPAINWMYWSEPAASLNGRKLYYPRGKVLGGSSSINALVYSRGQPSDYDGWEAEGNPGWGWEKVASVYRRMERQAGGEVGQDGGPGPLCVSDVSKAAHPLCDAFFDAARHLGIPFSEDLNGACSEGVGHYRITTDGGWRASAATAYLWPARRRRNLRISTDSAVTRILFDGRRATGVEYRRRGARQTASAGREVIVCAGAIASPQLLMLSGIGPGDELSRHGIEVRHHLPAVGGHLHDHVSFDLFYASRVASLNSTLASPLRQALAGAQYALLRRGPLSMSLNQAGGFVRTSPDCLAADLQLYFCPVAYDKPAPGELKMLRLDRADAFSISGSPCCPKSRGHISLRSADPEAAPEIHPNLLSHPEDVAQAVGSFRFIRRLAEAPPLARIIERERMPGAALQGDDEIADHLRSTCYSIFHPVGTCRMGPDPAAAVVDHRLLVHGLTGLRIADASVFPSVTSGNTNAPAIMVGEMAAAAILGA